MSFFRKARQWFHGPIGTGRAILLVIVAGGLIGLVFAGVDHWLVEHERRTLVTIPCTIEQASMSREAGQNERNLPGWTYVPVVTYQYEVRGVRHTGRTVSSRPVTIRSSAAAEKFLEKFGPGSDAQCYVDPENPGYAMLELPTNEQSIRVAKFSGVAVILGLAALAGLQLLLRTCPPPNRPRPRSPGWGEPDHGPRDPLARTRQLLRDKLES